MILVSLVKVQQRTATLYAGARLGLDARGLTLLSQSVNFHLQRKKVRAVPNMVKNYRHFLSQEQALPFLISLVETHQPQHDEFPV